MMRVTSLLVACIILALQAAADNQLRLDRNITALTYDREDRCVEGAGIPVDVPAEGSDDEALALAAGL